MECEIKKIMRYLSLFSGIGGFEQSIQKKFTNATCIGYSEIDKYALKIYQKHFPNHHNLGDIKRIQREDILQLGRCDLVIAGFPCTNLSSMANFKGNNQGLEGPKSGLFYELVRILKYIIEINPNVYFIIENNHSMRLKEKENIYNTLSSLSQIYVNVIDNSLFGIQKRTRIIWSNFNYNISTPLQIQTWGDVLEPLPITNNYKISDKLLNCLNKLYDYNNPKGFTTIAIKHDDSYMFQDIKTKTQKSRWEIQKKSDTSSNKSRTIVSASGGSNNLLIDRRGYNNTHFIVRKFTVVEIERLFGFPDNYTDIVSDTQRKKCLGNSIPIFIVDNIIKDLVIK